MLGAVQFSFLAVLCLDDYEDKIIQLGATTPSGLKDIQSTDLASIGMSLEEIAALEEALAAI